jgi:phosphate-selective porin OprO/OprP
VKRISTWIFGLVIITLFLPTNAEGQDTAYLIRDGTQGELLVNLDSLHSVSRKKPWNEFDLKRTSLKIGGGFLYEFGAFDQNAISKIQSDSNGFSLEPTFKVRDFRVTFSGQFKSRRTITWKMGIMFDGPSSSWFVRETGIMVAVPELWGNFFAGRTKEGFSMNKVMNGYAGWALERQMAIDVIPILADGIKWLGFLPRQNIFWNLGGYTDWLSKGQSFSTYLWQVDARFGWLPINAPKDKTVLHLGLNLRYGEPVDHQMRLKSRPEAFTSPYFIDTKTFPSDHSFHFGPEAYYSHGPFMLGSEIYWHHFYSRQGENHLFPGLEVMISYMLTGASRSYMTDNSIYGFVPVNNPIFKGGMGQIEFMLRYTQLDLNSGSVQGGKFWRITPMINWYLASNIRFELAYGYGILDQYGVRGATQFFQSRIQLLLN